MALNSGVKSRSENLSGKRSNEKFRKKVSRTLFFLDKTKNFLIKTIRKMMSAAN